MGTYSFLNVNATLSGPTGSISLGSSAGVAEEGISVEMIDDKNQMTVGADGTIMHSLRASNAARFTIRLLKTSPANALLSAAYNLGRSSSALWGQMTLVVSDVVRGDVVTGDTIAFAKQPTITYATNAGMNEWSLMGNVIEELGAGVPDVNVA